MGISLCCKLVDSVYVFPSRLFGIQCAGCNDQIQPNDLVMRAKTQVWCVCMCVCVCVYTCVCKCVVCMCVCVCNMPLLLVCPSPSPKTPPTHHSLINIYIGSHFLLCGCNCHVRHDNCKVQWLHTIPPPYTTQQQPPYTTFCSLAIQLLLFGFHFIQFSFSDHFHSCL